VRPSTPENGSISRRKLLGLSVAGALAGGTWTTGLGILARGVRPQFFVIGDDAWQLMLIEHGRRRALLTLGEFDDDPEASVSRLTTSLRQHVDIVIGDRNFLSRASSVISQWHGTVHI
jgi:hypothetical protein